MIPILADAMNDQTALAAATAMMGTIAIIGLGFLALSIWFFWRIFTKAGFNGALALLNLIPSFGFLICIIILAFSTWPIEQQRQMEAMGVSPSGPPMPT